MDIKTFGFFVACIIAIFILEIFTEPHDTKIRYVSTHWKEEASMEHALDDLYQIEG